MAIHHSNPFEAKEIASYCVLWMQTIQEAKTREALKDAWAGFAAYADAKHVCKQIREHMSDVYAATSRSLGEPVYRDPTGEAA